MQDPFYGGPQATSNYFGVVKGGSVPSSGIGSIGDATGIDSLTSPGSTTANTEFDVTSSSLSLTPGRWIITYDLMTNLVAGASAGVRLVGIQIRMTDLSNVAVAVSTQSVAIAMGASEQNYVPINHSFILDIATTTTYKLRVNTNVTNAGAGGTVSVYSGGITAGLSCTSGFYAIKIQ